MVPALPVDRGGCRLGVLPVAGEAAGAAGHYLAVLGDAGLDPGDGLADRPEHVPVRAGEAHHGTHLGRAVALEDVHAHVRPAARDVGVEGRGAHADGVQPAAELLDDGPEQEALDRLRHAPRDGVQPLEGRPPARLIHPSLDRAIQQAQPLRHDQ